MNPKVEQWLKEQQKKENERKEIEKNNLLVKIGLGEAYDCYAKGRIYNRDLHKYIKAEDVTDEEYNEILKYAYLYESQTREDNREDNGENGLRVVAVIVLALCILCSVILFIYAISMLDSWFGKTAGIISLFSAFLTIVSGFILYWSVKVITNISLKTTEIRDLLKKK